MKKYIKYEKEFKVDAVKLVIEQGLKPRIVSERLGIAGTKLYRWIEEYRRYGDEAFCDSGKALSVDAKLRQKDKKIAELREELEILKKVAAYFAKSPKSE